MRFPRKRRPILLGFLAAAALVTCFAAPAGRAPRHARREAASVPRKDASTRPPAQESSPLPTPTPLADKMPLPTPTPAPAEGVSKRRRALIDEARTAQALPDAAGSLRGRFTSPPTPRTVNLTPKGVLDWAHWGNGGAQVFDHKAGVAQQISNFTRIGTSSTKWLGDNPTTFSWTDGTPHASAANLQYGVYAAAAGNGFEFSVPADTGVRTLKVYAGLWRAQGRLEASLSDGSAPAFVDASLTNSEATGNGVYTFTYRAASAGQTLRIRYTVLTDYAAPFGNVT